MQCYDKKEVGVRIKRIRRGKGFTQCQLAELMHYANERQLQRIENGETNCTVDRLMEIAQLLEVSTDYLLFGKQMYQYPYNLPNSLVEPARLQR